MRSPSLAIAWELLQGHRWGIAGLAGYLVGVGFFEMLGLGTDQGIRLDPPNGAAGVVLVPLAAIFMYFLAVFSFGLQGDLAARPSIYPARFFTLPVPTAALAGWPMLYGAAAMAILWLCTALLGRWSGIDLPWIWPGLLALASLAWTQALMWLPYPLPGLRVLVTVFGLAALDAIVILALHLDAPEKLMAAVLAPLLPLAYLVARFALGRARQGDIPDWQGAFARLAKIADLPWRRIAAFPSPAHAQRWFEWRRHGRSLPALVAILLPCELALLFVAGSGTPRLVFATLVAALLTPPFLAGFSAAAFSRSNTDGSDAYGLTPFQATRPMTGAALVAAKLQMALWSTLAAWLVLLIGIPLGLTLSGTWPVLVEGAGLFLGAVGLPRAIAIALLGAAALVASTWSLLLQNLYLGLSGRAWLVKTSVLLSLAFLVVLGPAAHWIAASRKAHIVLWDALPWIPAILVVLKMSAAAWIATRLHRRRLLDDRALLLGAAAWLALVLALYALLAWLVAAPIFPRYQLALLVIVAIPLARLSAAPLALEWNRHR